MNKPDSSRRITRVIVSTLVGAAVVVASASLGARAADNDGEEEEAPDIKFFRNILSGLGLKRDDEVIRYRERSPLVVPPSRSLPPPETGDVAAKNPAWPKDPDVQRAKQVKADRKKPRKDVDEESLPELPNQLNRPGAKPRTGAPTAADNKDPTLPSTNAELGAKSVFNVDALLGRNKDEYTTFVSEPPRVSLTEPPPGYRTPSPAQPYGVGKEKWMPGAINPTDTPAMRGMER
jgi:hypothetical protein